MVLIQNGEVQQVQTVIENVLWLLDIRSKKMTDEEMAGLTLVHFGASVETEREVS